MIVVRGKIARVNVGKVGRIAGLIVVGEVATLCHRIQACA